MTKILKLLTLEDLMKSSYAYLNDLLNRYERLYGSIDQNGNIIHSIELSYQTKLIVDANITTIRLAMFYMEKNVLIQIPIEPDQFGIEIFSLN